MDNTKAAETRGVPGNPVSRSTDSTARPAPRGLWPYATVGTERTATCGLTTVRPTRATHMNRIKPSHDFCALGWIVAWSYPEGVPVCAPTVGSRALPRCPGRGSSTDGPTKFGRGRQGFLPSPMVEASENKHGDRETHPNRHRGLHTEGGEDDGYEQVDSENHPQPDFQFMLVARARPCLGLGIVAATLKGILLIHTLACTIRTGTAMKWATHCQGLL